MPSLPDPHAIAIMALTLFALVLFAQERIALETSSLLVFIALVAGFQVFPYQGGDGMVQPSDLFAGFGHEALVAVCALMVLGKGMETTGALQPVARLLARLLPRIGHIQIADVPDRHEPGSGEINFYFLLHHIDRLGYSGWIGCEYNPRGDTLEGLTWAKPYL